MSALSSPLKLKKKTPNDKTSDLQSFRNFFISPPENVDGWSDGFSSIKTLPVACPVILSIYMYIYMLSLCMYKNSINVRIYAKDSA